jgi:adenine-specific DNA-methyltransferase
MTISATELIYSLNKAYRLIKPRRVDLDAFKENLLKLLNHIDEKESEENIKLHLMNFLKDTFYQGDYLVAPKGKTDFVIHLKGDAKSDAGVLVEVKRPGNKNEMVSKTNLNTKAMHELILYFLRERLEKKNNSLTHLVITNIYQWYVFDAALFERVFTENRHFQTSYIEWQNKQKVSSSTDLFYTEIAKPFLEALEHEISFTHFDLQEYLPFLKSNSEKNDKKLIPLYKFFTPPHLLKLPFINDSNSLDRGFYSELLHILGLTEEKDAGRKIIRQLPIAKRNPGSLIENAINILEVEETLRKLPLQYLSGDTKEDHLFNLGLELSITWINRILFLKLLEAQLIKYHNGNQRYKFLNVHTIKDYDELHKLFFQVLARETKDRTPQIQKKYEHIPYLNSSLFEISELEGVSLKISGLDGNLDIPLYSNSVLKKSIRHKDVTSMNTLHYLFEFLESYDFSSVGKEEVQEENKTIINAAVLGLVFEKINGYRDGSIYTPGAITVFLCQETIQKAIIKKFNDAYGWNCESIHDIANYLRDRRNAKDILEFNKLVESTRIVDPAVGSGHFLVSSLNEMILIKSQLGILADDKGNRLDEIEISIANDELIIGDIKSKGFFEYTVAQGNQVLPYVQKVQQIIFNEKRKLIEQCLFGVDINPNSVKICQLRLWIELLKHAYYKPESGFAELETLPNIDINIKCGNSLLHKYSLQEDLTEVFKTQEFSVSEYQSAVASYKEAPNKDAKAKLSEFLKTIKDKFRQSVFQRDPRRKTLSESRGKLYALQNNTDLFGEKKKSQTDVDKEIAALNKIIDRIQKEIDQIENNAIYRGAFEWRFEFPEVLNAKGDFEGFDVLIGNPPYIQLQKMGEAADLLQTMGYATFTRTGDIYCLFYEMGNNLLKPGYFLGFITSNKWMRANYGEATRKYFLEHTNPLLLVDFGGYQVFDSATVDTNILLFQNSVYTGKTQTCLFDKSLGSLEKMSDFIRQSTSSNEASKPESGWVILSPIEAAIKKKIEQKGVPLKDWEINIYRGILTGYNEAFLIDKNTRDLLVEKSPKAAEIIRPILKGRDIKKYSAEFDDRWIIFTRRGIDIELYPSVKEHLYKYYDQLKPKTETDVTGRKPGNYKWFEIQDNVAYFEDFKKEKIIWIELSDAPKFSYDNEKYYAEATAFIMTGPQLKYLTAFLNSKLCDWYFDKITTTSGVGTNRWKKIYIEHLPIPTIDVETEALFENKLNSTLECLAEKKDISQLDNLMNNMVLDLYQFDQTERQLILSFRN